MKNPCEQPRRAALALAIATLLAATPLAAQPTDRHAAAVALARAGDHTGALAALERLAIEQPDDPRIVHDQIVVLGWAGRDAEALAKAAGVDIAGAPAYVLEGIGRSARNLRRFGLAESVYRRAVARYPDRIESRIGLAMTLADRGDQAAAATLLDEALALRPDDAGLLEARGLIAGQAGDWIGSLTFHQKALDADPQRVESLRGVVRAAAKLGAPSLAADIAARHPGLLSEAERASFAGDSAALGIRWGKIEERIGAGESRFAWLDRTLTGSDAVAARLAAGAKDGFDESARRQLADRLVALTLRRRAADASALYEQMVGAGIPVPPYARQSAADALLESRRPEQAVRLYREVLAQDGANFDAAMGLFYALVESERIDEATDHIDRLSERTPRLLPDGRPNPDAVAARVAQALVRMYGDRPDDAESRIRTLIAELPRNASVREAFASIALARGWPRLADEEFRRALSVDPASAGLRAQRSDALLSVQAYPEAREQIAEAAGMRADDWRVRRAVDLWAVHELHQLTVASGIGRSGGDSPTGTDDWRFDARLYSRPLADRWRIFGLTARAQADFAGGAAHWHREGLGAEWRGRNLRATAAATFGSTDRVGFEATADWQFDDRWSFSVYGSSVTPNLPMQAWNAGVHASELAATARHAVNESRIFSIGATQMSFSDDNRRRGYWGSWFERWHSAPRWRLESTAWLGTSRNTLTGRPYFNPERDMTASVELAGEWLTWRRYERSFRQRLSATVGSYVQRGFGGEPILGVGYEHVWDIDRRLSLRYGIGHLLRSYDGDRTGRTFGSLMLDGRF